MHSQPLHQGLRQGQGEAGYDAQDPAVQGVRGRGLREAGVQLQGYVSDLYVVIRAQPSPLGFFGFYYALMTFSLLLFIYTTAEFWESVKFCIAWGSGCAASGGRFLPFALFWQHRIGRVCKADSVTVL